VDAEGGSSQGHVRGVSPGVWFGFNGI
jgi:hypothetical protein